MNAREETRWRVVLTLSSVTYRTLSCECYHALKKAILHLDLPPGMPLDEGQLAQQLGTSKTPVREALAQLAGEELVVAGPARKTYVAPLSIDRVREIYQVRIMLESSSIRDVTPLLTAEELDELAAMVRRSKEALVSGDFPTFTDANQRFHLSLIEKSGNQLLIAIMRRLFDQARRVSAALFRVERETEKPSVLNRGVDHHEAILDALRARSADRASEAIRLDIQSSLDGVMTPQMQEAFRKLEYRPEN